MGFQNPACGGIHAVTASDIDRNDVRAAAGGADFVRKLAQPTLGARRQDRNRASMRHVARDLGTNSARGTDDPNNTIFQKLIH